MDAKLLLALQPIMSASHQRYAGHEVLSRFCVPPDIVPPHPYVKEGEWAKLDASVSEIVLEWMSVSHPHLRLPVFLNLSAHTIGDTGLFEAWLNALNRVDEVIRQRLVIEVSEATQRHALDKHWDMLKATGVRVALDDFGKENSGIKRLMDFPWDFCKFHGPALDSAMIAEAIRHCQASGVSVIMECVENQLASDHALAQGCDLQQGFHFAKPRILDISIVVHNNAFVHPFQIEPSVGDITRANAETPNAYIA